MTWAEIADALIELTPELLRFGRDLLHVYGDKDLALIEIRDRRAEIQRRREAMDQALAAKYRNKE